MTLRERILEALALRPMSTDVLMHTLGANRDWLTTVLREMAQDGRIAQRGGKYGEWRAVRG